MKDMPDFETGVGAIHQMAISYHEMVKSFQSAGFSRKEAMEFAIEHFSITTENVVQQNNEDRD